MLATNGLTRADRMWQSPFSERKPSKCRGCRWAGDYRPSNIRPTFAREPKSANSIDCDITGTATNEAL